MTRLTVFKQDPVVDEQYKVATSVKRSGRIMAIVLVCFMTTSCIGSAIGVVVDTAIEVVKVPFKIGGAVVDVIKGDDDFAEKLAEDQDDDVDIDEEQKALKMEANEFQ